MCRSAGAGPLLAGYFIGLYLDRHVVLLFFERRYVECIPILIYVHLTIFRASFHNAVLFYFWFSFIHLDYEPCFLALFLCVIAAFAATGALSPTAA